MKLNKRHKLISAKEKFNEESHPKVKRMILMKPPFNANKLNVNRSNAVFKKNRNMNSVEFKKKKN